MEPIFPHGKNKADQTKGTNPWLREQFTRADSATPKAPVRSAAVVQGAAKQRPLQHRHLEASAHPAAELSPA